MGKAFPCDRATVSADPFCGENPAAEQDEIRMAVFETNRPSHPDPVLAPGRRSAPAEPFAWGRCPLAQRKGSLALDRDGLPSLPRGCMFLTLAKSFDPLVQAG